MKAATVAESWRNGDIVSDRPFHLSRFRGLSTGLGIHPRHAAAIALKGDLSREIGRQPSNIFFNPAR